MTGNATKYLSLSLIALPSLFFVLRFLASFPLPPVPVPAYPSLASLPRDARSWTIYPEDFYEGGSYVSFPVGRVRYWVLGPENGKKIVLIHGLSVPAIVWKDVAPQLAAKGFRVLVYDLYGRGYSDAPSTPYHASLYTVQLALLMQHVRWDNAHIAALSMGGGIATAFAACFPHLTTGKIALIASTGLLEASDLSRTSKLMSLPLVQYVTSSAPFRRVLQKLGAGDPSPNPLHEIVQIQSAYLPGYNYAIASSLRDGPLRGLRPSFAELASRNTKLLLIWGTADNTVPYRYAAHIQALVPNTTLLTVEDGSHDLTVSHPDLVSSALVNFFGTSK
ncbi:alpha/beta-hydrolase [Phellopilus nigrolimitatus]|nr:alpha/beta-hydrolase [Phellopilus nigrolimitatus]